MFVKRQTNELLCMKNTNNNKKLLNLNVNMNLYNKSFKRMHFHFLNQINYSGFHRQ